MLLENRFFIRSKKFFLQREIFIKIKFEPQFHKEIICLAQNLAYKKEKQKWQLRAPRKAILDGSKNFMMFVLPKRAGTLKFQFLCINYP